MASSPGFGPPCTPHTPCQPTVNNRPPHTRPPVVVPLEPPTPPRHCAQDPISPRTGHLLNTVEPSTMRDLVDMGLMRYRFAVQRRGQSGCTSEGGVSAGASLLSQALKGHWLLPLP